MLIHIPALLTRQEITYCRTVLEKSQWVDGRVTAGDQSARAKFNLQIPHDSREGMELADLILQALGRNPTFNSAALPLRVFPPLFNRYDEGMRFHTHVDNAIRPLPGTGFRIRTDVSSTLFLSDLDEYDGGELLIQDTYGMQEIRVPAGDMVLYPATSLHSVREVTRGSRWASFFWSQSMIRNDVQRTLLYQFDQSIIETRRNLPDDHPAVLGLTATYHNLLRQWSEL
ncbi:MULTISPECIES: Fe2+-dependent dioxygenase [Komagataeibacter]|uniref:Fe2+-dependent dioxygenase n=2 Tax=Komagataeibacter TaxID=1434011 RepID=A0A318QVP4_9PROT|nr:MULTISPECIES: Fe2+-dependent dioxygenase [Komagataeibacter]GBR38743.1 hydroxylase [Komagataeibacter oboediens DSM 11826]MBL7233272.1 Fe2+-dependent dioxygenase [Komagataeibacter oboediens]MBT0675514.1 Fe2+-dependent dioxygenase [Komagataeibacter oboediens]MBT0679884.1 Fe2+-dependent dioxygenase [Komagataeibacter oboediens]MBV0889933.1 Fe2+-dependent dioxygenase [Komagataeibacter oboediens]